MKANMKQIGDRQSPLEVDPDVDAIREHSLIGRRVEVSLLAGGTLLDLRGKIGSITGVYEKYGVVVGYEVDIKGTTHNASLKDLYVNREYLEDIQPPTPSSVGVKTALSHWGAQRDYWHNQTDGVEALCFDLASVTPRARVELTPGGWRFLVPSLVPNDRVVVNCHAPLHGNFWSLGVMTYPEREPVVPMPLVLESHWQRVFSWTYQIVQGMERRGFPWSSEAIALRARASALILKPLVEEVLEQCVEAKRDLFGPFSLPPGYIDAAFSKVRIPAGAVGLTEPPTDQRPYTILSVSPEATRDSKYLHQVLLHECIHIVTASEGGDPHSEEFIALADRLGLEKKHRD